ncbi:MAG TPA: adenylate/guanylate cyclase domain-containing protein [Candidatus Binatia bacterium]|nr:adenylate/guanylate cyclase domain-containing protein [Candidatus Binatia bacterium]
MTCPRCGHPNLAQAKFCEECGSPLARRCSRCGTGLTATAKFCPECGEPAGAPPAVEAPARFAAPDAYTPRHLAERILVSRSALEGERKQVTVLFADLKGSMELLAARDPEEARRVLDPVLERMMEAVHFYEGTVNQVMGDGIMALFGAPVAHEDHAIRACYAALRMQDAVKTYAEQAAAPVQIRVGLNSGDVVVRSVGSDLRMDYSAVGQTTHLAARMEQVASPGSILMTPATLRLVEEWVQVAPLGRVPIKGLSEPLDVFELIGANAVRSRFQARAGRGLSRFVGRSIELAALASAFERARRGQGQIVAVIAEAGLGKSRLCAEFVRSAATRDALVLETGCISYRKATSYLPVIELLRGYFQIETRDDPAKIREKITGKVLSLDAALEPFMAAYQWLLDVPIDDPQWQRLDAPQRRQRAVDGVKRLLLAEARVQPVVLLFEDLHWLDAETQGVLDSLVEGLITARLLLLVTYRPEYRHGWGGKSYYRQVRIEPLEPATADELLDALLGTDRALEPLKRRLVARTQGNPFFIEETVRTLRESGVLAGEPGNLRLTQHIDSVQVAPTVQVLLAARIDRLPDEEKRLLQCAAVVGTDVPFTLLQAVADQPDEDLRRGLGHLQAVEFLYESRLFPDLEFSFRHALTHDVAYGSLLQDRRRALHARIVEAIERLYRGRLAEHVERLAHHAFRGEVWPKAATYCRQAGLKAQGRSAHREAVSWFEQALTAVHRLPDSREAWEQIVDLRLNLRASLYPLGEFQAILEHLQAAEALAGKLDDELRQGWVALHLGDYLRHTGRFADACAYLERASAIAQALRDAPLRLSAGHYLGLTYHALGDYRQAAAWLRAGVDVPAEQAGGEWRTQTGSRVGFEAINLAWLARSLADAGEFDEAVGWGRRALELAEQLNTPYSLTATAFALGSVLALRGEFQEAIPLLERARSIALEWDIPLYACHVLRALGYAYVRTGRVGDGLALLRESVAGVEARSLAVQQARVLALLGEALLLSGRTDEAAATAARALQLARERGQRGDEATALAVLALIAATADPPDQAAAEQHYRAALDLAVPAGMRPLEARCRLALGMRCLDTGRAAEAAAHLGTAAALAAEMQIPAIARQALAALGRIGPVVAVASDRPLIYERLGGWAGDEGPRVILGAESSGSGAPAVRVRTFAAGPE